MKKLIWMLLILITSLSIITTSCVKTTTKSQNLVNGSITVPAGKWYYILFSVDKSTISDPRVSGSFQASGGSGNDIIVLAMDEMSYINWSNGHQVTPIFNSGQITTANIDFTITSTGKYYLVYSNTFSVFSDKVVNTNVSLSWSE